MRLGLLKLDPLQEGWEEVGRRDGDPEPLVRALERKGYLTPYQTHKLLKDDPDGYFLGGYRILYKIASGSFGRVYRGDDLGCARDPGGLGRPSGRTPVVEASVTKA